MDAPEMKVVPVEFRDVIATSVPGGGGGGGVVPFDGLIFNDTGTNILALDTKELGAKSGGLGSTAFEGIGYYYWKELDPVTLYRSEYTDSKSNFSNIMVYNQDGGSLSLDQLIATYLGDDKSSKTFNGRYTMDADGLAFRWAKPLQ